MSKYLDNDGLLYLWQKLKALLNAKASTSHTHAASDITSGTLGSARLPTASASALGGIKVGNRLTISNGVLSADEQGYTHPSYTAVTGMPAANQTPAFGATFTVSQITSDSTGHLTGAVERTIKIPSTTVTQSKAGLMSAADKKKLDDFGSATDYALKSDISSMYKHKGSVSSASDLPASGNNTGDVYNVTATGMNYVWTGTAWDALGEAFSIDSITNAEIDTILSA